MTSPIPKRMPPARPRRLGRNPAFRARFPAGLQPRAAYTIICLCALLFLYQVLEDSGAWRLEFLPVVVLARPERFAVGMSPVFLVASIALTPLVEVNRSAFQSSRVIPRRTFFWHRARYAMAHYRLTLINALFQRRGRLPARRRRPELETASRARNRG